MRIESKVVGAAARQDVFSYRKSLLPSYPVSPELPLGHSPNPLLGGPVLLCQKENSLAQTLPSQYFIPMPKAPTLTLKVGDPAPAFTAENQHGKTISLENLQGKPVVLYFYPKDDTPGCTKEACAFRDAYADFKKAGAIVLGVSIDPVKSHLKFADKFQLPFDLLSDPEKKIVQDYGVWGEKSFMGRNYMGTHRVTFLIAPDGRIARIWPAVKPETHPAEVLDAIRASGKTQISA